MPELSATKSFNLEIRGREKPPYESIGIELNKLFFQLGFRGLHIQTSRQKGIENNLVVDVTFKKKEFQVKGAVKPLMFDIFRQGLEGKYYRLPNGEAHSDDLDYLRGKGLVTAGAGPNYGAYQLTHDGVEYIKRAFEEMEELFY